MFDTMLPYGSTISQLDGTCTKCRRQDFLVTGNDGLLICSECDDKELEEFHQELGAEMHRCRNIDTFMTKEG